ncbi:MAG: Cytochrome c biogenesis protein CcsA [Syntrophorhabdus sp. PtaB.Bin184]|jgi:cytochrome c-type biogenesis protein CcsB|nr:MAG: Cytochrome c biogenesis protein CcsA [Syntrophorhabdus sp. PtaB.Bin184]
MNVYLYNTALGLYLASTLVYAVSLASNRPRFEKPGYYLLAAAFVVHFASTVARFFEAGYTPITNIYESLSFLALCIAGFFIYIRKAYRVEMVGSIIAPLVTLIVIMSLGFPSEIRPLIPALRSAWLPVHTVLSFLGNGIFVVGFFISILYLLIEKEIKRKRSFPFSDRFPSLETLDRINYRCMSLGFPFLTAGIITGSIWAGFAWGSYWRWDPKETWSLITWIVYAILFHNRLALGWRGRRTAYMMILGFLLVLFTFLGVNFLLKSLHAYV